jgi:CubicO group peptidase (beta-lactamase class C family)
MLVRSRRWTQLCRIAVVVLGTLAAPAYGQTADYAELDRALAGLAQEGRFSGAVVVRNRDSVQFAQGYGLADPFEGRAFTPATLVDSASLAKPVTALMVLDLIAHGRIALEVPVHRYLPEFPDVSTTVGQLLAHSAGLPFSDSEEALRDASNEALLVRYSASGSGPDFAAGSRFEYCNMCHLTLALLVERVTGRGYLEQARRRVRLPQGISIRPGPLAEWSGRAIGYRLTPEGPRAHDSFEGERFYGSANLSVSALQLAEWGSAWLDPALDRSGAAASSALISGKPSGLTWGNWYCAQGALACHYPGHHQGFHHMLYRDSASGIVVALVSNNTLAAGLQQPLQRAVVAFARGETEAAAVELQAVLDDRPVAPGTYSLPDGTRVTISADNAMSFAERAGLRYPIYPVSRGIGYAPGLDAYLAPGPDGTLRWLTLYEDILLRRGD